MWDYFFVVIMTSMNTDKAIQMKEVLYPVISARKYSQKNGCWMHIRKRIKCDCDKCNKAFKNKRQLNKHMTKHDKECPYQKQGCFFKHKDSAFCKFGQNCKKEECVFINTLKLKIKYIWEESARRDIFMQTCHF